MAKLKTQSPLLPAPCSVERTSKTIIEHKLLVALDDKTKVAILADEDDLETMILGLRGVAAESGRRSHAEDLADGMEQLMREAFPPNKDYQTPVR